MGSWPGGLGWGPGLESLGASPGGGPISSRSSVIICTGSACAMILTGLRYGRKVLALNEINNLVVPRELDEGRSRLEDRLETLRLKLNHRQDG
eukprot:3901250-Alexandrium_andersonii.AAC.1